MHEWTHPAAAQLSRQTVNDSLVSNVEVVFFVAVAAAAADAAIVLFRNLSCSFPVPGGGRAVLRNGGRALILSSAVVYGGAWMKRRGFTLPQITKRDDTRDGAAEA